MFKYHLGGTPPSSPVAEVQGRWYIMMGYSGFNSPANNRWGYASRQKAEEAILRYQNKSRA